MRTTFVVTFNPELRRWVCSVGGQIIKCNHPDGAKAKFVGWVKDQARFLWSAHHVPTEVKVSNKHAGRFTAASCTTYGKDPIKTKG